MPPARPPVRHAFALVRRVGGLLAAACAALAGGCFYTDNGLSPPIEGFYFPTGLVVSPGRNALYVANSDFDLQYNGGTVAAVDLKALRGTLLPLLYGIRCSGGNTAECACAAGQTAPACRSDSITRPNALISDVCNLFAVSQGQGVSGQAACQLPNDCFSGNCVIGSDGVTGVCQDCKTDLDCPGPGFCGISDDGSKRSQCKLSAAGNTYLTPAVCTPLAPPVQRTATIGAFASGAVMALDNCGPASPKARLFVPVRGDPSITWFDVVDDRTPGAADPFLLDCGQTTPGGRCDDGHRIGVDPYENFRGLTLPVSPVGLDVSSDGTYVVSAHQIAGSPAVGLSVNSWSSACPTLNGVAAGLPSFQFYLTGAVAPSPSEVARVPEPALVAAAQAAGQPLAYQQGFVVTYSAAAEVDIFRVNPDAASSPSRPFLSRAGQTPITVNATGTDSRGLVIDPTERQACEATCAGAAPAPGTATNACQLLLPDNTGCLVCCVDTPLQMYIANRSPPSLLLGHVRSQVVNSDVSTGTGSGIFDFLEIYDQVPLTVGPSKVVLGHALMPDGTLKSFVFVVAFDTKTVFMYDPVAQQVVAVIGTSGGPDAIGFDSCCDAAVAGCTQPCGAGETPHALLYVGHFTESYIGAVDLDIGHPETFGTMFASIGEPLPPLESK